MRPMGQRNKLYLAAPLFNDMERRFNAEVADRLQEFFDVFLPQRDGGLMVEMIKDGANPSAAARKVFQIDVGALDWCDVLLIVLDGRAVDEGAAFELGYAYAQGKTCCALQTDVRRLLSFGNNPMIEGAVHELFQSVDELLVWARRFAVEGARASRIRHVQYPLLNNKPKTY